MVLAAASIDLPPTSAWFYFLLHLIAAATNLIAVILTVSPLAASTGLRRITRTFGCMSHGGSAVLHFFLGINSFFGWSTRNPDGTVPWFSMLIVATIAVGVPFYLRFAQQDVSALIRKRSEREFPS